MVSGRAVPRSKTENTTQLAVRIPETWLSRLDGLIPWLAKPGVAATRTDAIRAVMARGLDAYEEERASESRQPRSESKPPTKARR
jgi:hypothetical protein